jgi:hypothetical protein
MASEETLIGRKTPAYQSPGRWIVPEICNKATVAVITMMKARITATLLSSGMGRAPSEVARTFVLRIGSAGEGTVGSGEFCFGSMLSKKS